MKVFKYLLDVFLEKVKFVFKYIWSYLIAKFGPRTNFDTYLNRMNVCKDCSWKIEKGNLAFCRACFCARSSMWPDAILWNKCRMKNAHCPRKKWEI